MADELKKMTVRLPPDAAERLRQKAFSARLHPSSLARDLIVMALDDPSMLPRPAPPALKDLSDQSRALVSTLTLTISNLNKLAEHARQIGGKLASIAEPEAPLDALKQRCRHLGLRIKSGHPAPCEMAASKLTIAAQQVCELYTRLNKDHRTVDPSEWSTPLLALRDALADAQS